MNEVNAEKTCADCWCRYCVNNIECDMEGEDFFCDGCNACRGRVLENPEDCPHKAFKGEGDVEKEMKQMETQVSVSDVLSEIKHELQDEYWELDEALVNDNPDIQQKHTISGCCIGLSMAIKILKQYEDSKINTLYDLNKLKAERKSKNDNR